MGGGATFFDNLVEVRPARRRSPGGRHDLTPAPPPRPPQRQARPRRWRSPSTPGRECCCCHKAIDLLEAYRRRHGFAIEVVDVDSDPALAEAHGLTVPVVAIDGKVRFKGVVNPVLLDRLDRGGRPRGLTIRPVRRLTKRRDGPGHLAGGPDFDGTPGYSGPAFGGAARTATAEMLAQTSNGCFRAVGSGCRRGGLGSFCAEVGVEARQPQPGILAPCPPARRWVRSVGGKSPIGFVPRRISGLEAAVPSRPNGPILTLGSFRRVAGPCGGRDWVRSAPTDRRGRATPGFETRCAR